MLGKPARPRPLHILALAIAPLVATLALTAAPAHAALTFVGNYTIRNGGCMQVENDGTTIQTPIVTATCDGRASQTWAVYQEDASNYWILAYSGQQPLNLCMDKGNGDHMWVYGCHGGRQQKWSTFPTAGFPQLITSQWNGQCVGRKGTTSTLAEVSCYSSFPPFPQTAPSWLFVPA